ncbi:MAG: glycosyltransferase [Chloroflexi bacterium]|nr:glycosyltransferase [Chloroflexota bacterium]
MRFSIVIPLKSDNAYIRETLAALKQVDYDDYEIIVLPDEPFDGWGKDVNAIATGAVGPGAKRDLALPHATGDILAFLDDDTYPDCNWLKNSVKYFNDPQIGAIGGPAVTPASDSLRQQASGNVYASFLGGGNYAYRYLPKETKAVDDYPTCNLLVRRTVFESIGGFDTTFWPGEDTKLCLDIVKRGLKIIYAPDVIVFHHRRPLFAGHLNQVRSYALHRGYFAKRFPQTSLRPSYFLPTFLVIGFGIGIIFSLFFPGFWFVYTVGMVAYVAAVFTSARASSRGFQLTLLTGLGIIATHLVYGVWFVAGLLSLRLSEESE